MKKSIIILCAALLCGCANNAVSSSSVVSSQGTEVSSSIAISSEESSIVSQEPSKEETSEPSSVFESSQDQTSEEPSSIPEVSSEEQTSEDSVASSEATTSVFETSQDVPGFNAWQLTSAALPANPIQGKNYNLEFSTTNGRGDTISFIGDSILKGAGSKSGVSIDNTIQLSKEEGQFYMTSGTANYLQIEIAHISQFYEGEDHDYTGVPTIYSADEMTADNGEKVEMTRSELENGHYLYSGVLPHSRFRLANESKFAIYIYLVSNL